MLRFPFSPDKPYTAVALNYTFPHFFGSVWYMAKTRIAADGGVNRIHKYFRELNIKDYKAPDFVAGDFDSVKPEVRKLMEARGSEFVHIYNQDYCDVQKAIDLVIEKGHHEPIICMGGYGGRFDHTAGVLNAALWAKGAPIFLLDNVNIMVWIKPENEGVEIPFSWTTGKCSIQPLCNPVKRIKTIGLKENLDGPLELGSNICMNLHMVQSKILIETTAPVLFICEVHENVFDRVFRK